MKTHVRLVSFYPGTMKILGIARLRRRGRVYGEAVFFGEDGRLKLQKGCNAYSWPTEL